ncbi:MAG: hypothetical protein ACFCUG_13340 [Thiotrichales bacterium]
MTYFLLGFVFAWIVEWLVFTYWWRPQDRRGSVATAPAARDGELDALRDEHERLRGQIGVKDRELDSLRQQLDYAKALNQERIEPAAATSQLTGLGERGDDSAQSPSIASPRGKRSTPGLSAISGIGPKTLDVLDGAGVKTLDDIEVTDVAALKTILEQAGPRYALVDPSSWPEQATLLKAGDLEGLKRLQDALKR